MTEERKIGAEIGNVVWFDQKKGFGFIKVITPESDMLNKDIFVHYTSIQSVNRFKKLYPGEYVSLTVEGNTESDDPKRKFNCTEITGLYGNNLLVDNDEYIIKVIRKKENRSVSKEEEEEDEMVMG